QRRRHPRSIVVPYTTLFRSQHFERDRAEENAHVKDAAGEEHQKKERQKILAARPAWLRESTCSAQDALAMRAQAAELIHLPHGRSEEHTSELQSRENLVCRL